MSKQKNVILILFSLFILSSCTQYDIREDGVYYSDWNEARGKKERLIKDADPKTFKTLKNDIYAVDKNHVFYKGGIILKADPKTFKLLGNGYAIDKNRAYYYGELIENSTSRGFEIINSYYSKDYKNIFYTTFSLNVCSVKSFKFVYNDNSESDWERWTTDGCNYFIKNYKVPSENYKNLKIYKGSAGISSDDKFVYYLDRNIYYNEEGKRILDTIDLNSFKVKDYLGCEDKFGCINVFHGRKNCE